MQSTSSPRPHANRVTATTHRHIVRGNAHDSSSSPRPRKRSLSPDSHRAHAQQQRPTRRRRSSTPSNSNSSSGDDEHHRRRRHRHTRHRDRSTSRTRQSPRLPENSSGRRDERRSTRHRSLSRDGSRLPERRRRRGSYERGNGNGEETRSPPYGAGSRSRARARSSETPPAPLRRHRPEDDENGDDGAVRRRRGRDEERRRRSWSREERSPPIRSRQALPSQLDSFRGEANGQVGQEVGGEKEKEKEKINWKTTGLLAAETNTVQVGGSNEKIVLKHNEPPDARKPPTSARWRLYIFKGADALGDLQLSTHSCWLVGREAAVADLLVEHPSSSKQHAVIQFRYVVKQEKDKEMGLDDFLAEFGEGSAAGGPVKEKGRVRPYLLDLESTNGTYLNGGRIGDRRYVELREKDIIKFGFSEREYVLLKE